MILYVLKRIWGRIWTPCPFLKETGCETTLIDPNFGPQVSGLTQKENALKSFFSYVGVSRCATNRLGDRTWIVLREKIVWKKNSQISPSYAQNTWFSAKIQPISGGVFENVQALCIAFRGIYSHYFQPKICGKVSIFQRRSSRKVLTSILDATPILVQNQGDQVVRTHCIFNSHTAL